ncbi:MAG: sirohydrochlorin chelatase [Cyanobacteria bacterium CRU_2_1]|nr:sirohydrochlorin chelatase [Cyanobacteria bacterium RU_5_0]NJR61118.1 sirohydrochlorin chelatase [Cyanobacteria bacterium CRU_2_1]
MSDSFSACLLVSHGSRDPRPQAAIDQLAMRLSQRSPHPIGTAALELAPLPLNQQIQEFAKSAFAAGYCRVNVLPLFLLSGVHVTQDIPAEVAIAQQFLHPDMVLELRPHLGSHPHLGTLLMNLIGSIATPATGKVLIAHGSRCLDSHQPVEALAERLGAIPAYWSVPPSLESQVMKLVQSGYAKIAILPYFLFEGGITDAIAQTVAHLTDHAPQTYLHLAKPIGVTPELTDLVLDLMA